MSAAKQPVIDQSLVDRWAEARGISLTLFRGWGEFVNEALFWSKRPAIEAAVEAAERIRARLIEIQVSEASVSRWDCLTGAN